MPKSFRSLHKFLILVHQGYSTWRKAIPITKITKATKNSDIFIINLVLFVPLRGDTDYSCLAAAPPRYGSW